jgi:hypothetical protein
MTISSVPSQLGAHRPDGVVAPGLHGEVIQSVGATRTLLAAESGSLCLFDRAAGNVYTLPAPVLGMKFTFRSTVAVTTNASKIITNSASVFLLGSVMGGSLTVADSGDVFQADGTTIVSVSMDGVTKGGLIGGEIVLVAISATQWSVSGDFVGSGTLATPFATS